MWTMEDLLPKDFKIVDSKGKVLSEDDIRAKIDSLKQLVEENAKLESMRTDDKYLMRFLHSCKFEVDDAYKKMENLYNLVVNYPQFHQYDSPVESKHLVEDQMRFMLKARDKEGRSVYLCKIGNVDPSKCTVFDVIRLDDMWLESMMDDPLTQAKGFSIVIDIKGYSFGLFRWLIPSTLQFGMKKVDCLPVADIKYHVVNTSFLLDASLKIVWPFLPSRIKESIKFHSNNWDSLHKYIDSSYLPPEYGGTADIDYDELNEEFLSKNKEIADKLDSYKFIVKNNSIKAYKNK